MATRLNIRFILILSVTVVAVAVLLGGLWFLQAKGDAARNIKAADEYMQLAAQAEARGEQEVAQNHYERAIKTYGRAVHKEPANLSYLDSMELALLKLRPNTRDEAAEFDDMRIAIMATRARYRPQDADTHLALLEELFQIARFVRARTDRWQAVAEAADDMASRVLREDPKRVYAQLYRGLALTRVLNPRVDSEADIEEAQQALKQFLAAVPDHDLAWSALISNQLSVARLLEVDGKTRRAKTAYDELDATIAEALKAAPDGPEIARVLALRLVAAYMDDPGSVDRDALTAAIDRMVELAGSTDDPLLLAECVEVLRATDLPGRYARAITLLSNYLAGHPDRHYHRALLAELHYLNDDYEAAEMAVETLLAAEPAPVSRLSRFQHILKVRAQSLNTDIAYRRWESAEAEQKPARLAKVEEQTNRLAAMVADPETDPLLLRAEGKLAFAKRDFPTAAQKFENALKLRPEFETVWYAAHSLEQIDQIGLAGERLDQARTLAPNSPQVLTAVARLQAKMGRFKQANETIEAILKIEPDYEPARRLAVFVELRQADDTPVRDETARAIADAQQAFEDGELDTARQTLLGVLEGMPNDVAVLTRLVGVEMRAGRTDEAQVYLNRALSSQPDNRQLRALEASLANDDPVEAMKRYIAELYEDEADRAVYMTIQLRSMASQFDASAQRYEAEGNAEAAADARARAERARAEVEPLLAAADRATPDHPALLEFFFTEAISESDWDRAEDIVVRAQKTDADQAGGLMFKGRLELATYQFEAAVRTLTDATERKHFSSLAWRLLGRAHEQMGNFAEALRAYQEAYRCNPSDRYVIRWYVGLLHQTGEMVRALRVLDTARQAIPNDPTLRNQWLELESEVGDATLALRERRETFRTDPEDTLNAMRLVALLSRATPSREFVLDDSGKPKYPLDKWNVLPLKEREESLEKVAAAWAAECDEILQSLEARGVKSLQLARLRADVLRARGDVAAGVQVLRSYADSCSGEEAIRAFIALANFESSTVSVGAAAKTLEHARQFQTEVREIDRALGSLYYTHSRWPEAVAVFRDLVNGQDDQRLKLFLAECLIKQRSYDEAEGIVKGVITADGPDYGTEMLSAEIAHGHAEMLWARGDRDEARRRESQAREALDRALRLQPTNIAPHIRLAQWLLAEYRRTEHAALLDDAMLALGRAEEAQAGAVPISVARFDVLQAKGDRKGAAGEMIRVLDRYPDEAIARQRLIQVYVDDGDLQRAIATVDEALERDPRSAMWHERKADLHLVEHDMRSAVASYRKAYHYEPTPGRETKFATAALALEQPDFMVVINTLVPDAKALEGRPVLRSLYARALVGLGKKAEAMEQMRVAYQEHREQSDGTARSLEARRTWIQILALMLSGEGPDAVEQFTRETAGAGMDSMDLAWLAEMWAGRGPVGLPKALTLQRQAVDRCPGQDTALLARLLMAQGQYELRGGDPRRAAVTFGRIVEIDPDNGPALNNAAYLWAEELNDPARALPMAERAKQLDPTNPDVLDTLGVVHFKLRNLQQAEEFLRQSVTARPSAESLLHLAQVQVAKGDYTTAETTLRRASNENGGRNAALQQEIERLSDLIQQNLKR